MKLTGEKIFITGGAGFIGSHVSELLAKHNHVTVYDNNDSAVTNFSGIKNIHLITGDILEEKKLAKQMAGHSIVIAMTAAHVRESHTKPLHVHAVNATGTLNVLRAAKEHAVKRFVYISSSEVYGTAVHTQMAENHPIAPTTVYGVSKYVGELYTKQFHFYQGLPTIVIRPFNTYGPRSHFDGYYGEVIPRMVIRALNNLPPLIFGDGTQSRDFTFVADTARGIVQALAADNLLGETVNVAYGKEVSIKEIAAIICGIINPALSPIHMPPRPQDVMRHAADTSKAKKIFDWKPTTAIADGIKQYIHWVKQTYPNPEALLHKVPDINWD